MKPETNQEAKEENKKVDKLDKPPFGVFGLALAIVSLVFVITFAYFLPDIGAFFNVKILLDGKPNVNIVIRLYAGFLFSTFFAFAAQFALWALVKIDASFDMPEYNKYSPVAKTVRNFNGAVLFGLWLLVSLLTGINFPRV